MQVARPTDDEMTRLLGQFACVRIVQTNRMDLSLFDFDRDLTFAAFFLNPTDRTIYGRYGTRSGDAGKADSTLAGFAAAMRGALALHAKYPAEKAALAAKTGPAPRAKVPEDLRELSRYSTVADFSNLNERSCIHCHQVGRAEALELRAAATPMSDAVLFPWPMPDALGLGLANDRCGTVTHVAPDSAAARAGFIVGDEIERLAGQPILSVADVQWVLHRATEPASIPATVARGGKTVELSLKLASGWRRSSSPSWRMVDRHLSLADLTRLGLGSVSLRPVSATDRGKLGVEPDHLALEVGRSRGRGRRGEAGGQPAAGGLEAGDILVAFDGLTTAMTEMDVLAHCVQKRKAGDEVPATVIRAGSKVELQLRLR